MFFLSAILITVSYVVWRRYTAETAHCFAEHAGQAVVTSTGMMASASGGLAQEWLIGQSTSIAASSHNKGPETHADGNRPLVPG